jgi:hypothetical protein
MDVNAKIDIGSNLTSLLERLAQQIGTTADKVFPWYVQQAYLDGVVSIVAWAVVFSVSLLAVTCGVLRGEWKYGEPGNLAAVLTILGGGCLVVSVALGMLGGSGAVTKVLNPQYHAMQMLTRDVGRLTAR